MKKFYWNRITDEVMHTKECVVLFYYIISCTFFLFLSLKESNGGIAGGGKEERNWENARRGWKNRAQRENKTWNVRFVDSVLGGQNSRVFLWNIRGLGLNITLIRLFSSFPSFHFIPLSLSLHTSLFHSLWRFVMQILFALRLRACHSRVRQSR